MKQQFDIECAEAIGIITPEEIANAPIVFINSEGNEEEL